MRISLHDAEWTVTGFHPWVPLLGNSMETGAPLQGVIDWIPATVPGGVHHDLYRAGHIEHPHIDRNSIACEWVENRWWLYRTRLPRLERLGAKLELVFRGLDYRASVYLNNVKIGEHEGMFHPAAFDITAMAREHETLELGVLFEHAPDEMGQIGKTSLTRTQKSRFSYKWDFSTRMVNIGLWDDVYLRVCEDVSIDEIAVHTDTNGGQGIIDVRAALRADREDGVGAEGIVVRVECADPRGKVVLRQDVPADGSLECRCRLAVDDAELWHPNGYGAQPLYRLKLQALRDGLPFDERELKVGIRKLEYARNEDSPDDSLPYTFVVNGKKIYIKGVNLTPLDLMYGNVTPERYEWLVRLMRSARVNMVRVWGGGLIEKETFYDLCDRYGIMIWQEFIQSSSGVDNEPSKIPEFLALLGRTAEAALKERRNHVSLTVWSGGNELMSGPNTPSTYEDENLAMLRDLVAAHDSRRLFLPTSASGPVEMVTREKGVSHDVHGNWKHLGDPEHYELYGESDSLFHSEFGVDGASPAKSLRKFLTEPHLRPLSSRESLVWRHHGGEWWDTKSRDEEWFGPLDEVETFVQCSQWLQADGLRFIVEANRRRAFRNSGSIIWQMNEPWPNVSCTSLVDYYGEAKMAYYWVRKAFAPVHASLDYRRLRFAPGESFAGRIVVSGSGEERPIVVRATVLNAAGQPVDDRRFEGVAPAYRSETLGDLDFTVGAYEQGLFFVRLQLLDADGRAMFENVYTFSTETERALAGALTLSPDVEAAALGAWREREEPSGIRLWERTYRVTNRGRHVAFYVYPEETSDRYWLEAEGAYEMLFPGETKDIVVRCIARRTGGLFAKEEAFSAVRPEDAPPSVVIRRFGDAAGTSASSEGTVSASEPAR
ncbi:glycoside hydrolase family 2 TIM barrel-domain containing protein [Paenibacillus sp.]|uniref:glycoside hydrolase family 2 protein n=1 Tax=Paenibacillus sp. TaxID=58172 RepID=UPI002812301D|nr:glycoside hydrolase family 2 TIM barrel-domain containing protein [Paenibacillus sp.]